MQRGIDHRRSAGRIAGCVSLIIAAMNVLIDFRVQADELVAPATAVPQQLILIIGAAGAEEFVPQFSAWADRWREAAARGAVECVSIGGAAIADANVGDAAAGAPPAEKSGDASNPTDRDRVLSELRRLVASGTSEPLWIVFIGHGTFDSRSAKLNLNGPDLSADELATALEPATRPVAAIFCASSTSPFINALSAPGRVVISATKDGNQIQFSRFGDAFSQAVAGLDADIDRDGQSSLLEAWLYASCRTAEFYKSEGRLAT